MIDPLGRRIAPDVIAIKSNEIRDTMLRESRTIRQPDFLAIGTDDLGRLFRLYDQTFFNGWLDKAVASTAGATLSFRLSSTMTRAGGKTIRKNRRLSNGTLGRQFEIAIATRMLFRNFREEQRAVTVCGLPCTDRLAALQRIMEHEILHLAEFLRWGKSSCNQRRFKTMARNIFGHLASRHDLITPDEHAVSEHDISPGAKVFFDFNGKTLQGLVNRVHRRATVLVESESGQRYRDGKRYSKYYVPLPMLSRSIP